ncbi:MAG: B12-binding domain-containing radical SAM protein, partial [Chlorobiaceae bacterium]|nr:B12-binding domain-containing radical SAM protein [Chlorobiaceae bacterium]
MLADDLHNAGTVITSGNGTADSLERLAREQKTRKKWLLVQPKSTTSMMVDSGSVSMPLNLIMVASLAGKL